VRGSIGVRLRGFGSGITSQLQARAGRIGFRLSGFGSLGYHQPVTDLNKVHLLKLCMHMQLIGDTEYAWYVDRYADTPSCTPIGLKLPFG
jgi:hypothetical protein